MTSNAEEKGPAAGRDPLLRILNAWRLPEPDPGLRERLVAQAMTWPQELPFRPPYRIRRSAPSFGWLLPRVASLAAGVAIGILVGLSAPVADEMASGVYSSLFDQTDQPSGTLVALDSSEYAP
jgi:hypothetical protein